MRKFTSMVWIALVLSLAMTTASCSATKKVSQAAADDAVEIKQIPCSDCLSTRDMIRSRAMRESMDQQMAQQMARSSALEDMASKINVAVSALVRDYYNSRNVNMNEEMERRFEGETKQLINQSISGYRTICEKYTMSTRPNGTKVFKCYYAIELSKEDVAKSLYQGLTKSDKMHLDYDYATFTRDMERELNQADNNR